METYLIRNVRMFDPSVAVDEITDLYVSKNQVKRVKDSPIESDVDLISIDGQGLLALPGLIDLHVHFRQPGFEYKETVLSGSTAALAGGVTNVVVMPNTSPVLDTADRVSKQLSLNESGKNIHLMVAAAVSEGLKGEKSNDYASLKKAGAVSITDDGRPVMDDELMHQALRGCVENDLIFMQHAEDLNLSGSAPMNQGVVSQSLGLKGQDSNAEGVMVERDIKLVKEYGARYHVLHISTKRALNAVREAKMRGLPVTCEVTPHHIWLTDEACQSLDPNKKMNPPLRCKADQQAVLEALKDGTIDAVASDHAPHSTKDKSCGFCDAPFGVVGLETAFAALLDLVSKGDIELEKAVALMTTGPASVLNRSGEIGCVLSSASIRKDLVLVDQKKKWSVDPSVFHGTSSNSAFYDLTFRGKVVATFLDGQLAYKDTEFKDGKA